MAATIASSISKNAVAVGGHGGVKSPPVEWQIRPFVQTHIHLAYEAVPISIKHRALPPKYYYVTPYELTLVGLQHALSTGNVVMDRDTISFTGKLIPSIQLETSNTRTDKRRDDMYTVYESGSTDALHQRFSRSECLAAYNDPAKCQYKARVIIDGKQRISSQDITYIKQIAAYLKTGIPICDLAGFGDSDSAQSAALSNKGIGMHNPSILSKYIIRGDGILGDGITKYVIVAYPDPSKMRQHLTLYDSAIPAAKSVNIEHDTIQLMMNMYNSVKPENSIRDRATELYKLYNNDTHYDYLLKWYREQLQLTLSPEVYATELATLQRQLPLLQQYKSNILLEYLNQPNIRIRYVVLFFIVKETMASIEYEPMVFNMKELNRHHTIALQHAMRMIRTEIPPLFGITYPAALDAGGPDNTGYKLFNTYCKYGDFFHLTAEYSHIMNNYSRYAYIYKNSMILEELIHASGRITDLGDGRAVLDAMKLIYELKTHRIDAMQTEYVARTGRRNIPGRTGSIGKTWNTKKNNTILHVSRHYNHMQSHNTVSRSNTKKTTRPTTLNRNSQRFQNVPVRRNSSMSSMSSNSRNDIVAELPQILSASSHIILMYERNYAEYILFIQTAEMKFYFIVIKSNMNKLDRYFQQYIHTLSSELVDSTAELIEVYSCADTVISLLYMNGSMLGTSGLFKVVECRPVAFDDYMDILPGNPLNYRQFLTLSRDTKIPFHVLFNSDLLPFSGGIELIYNTVIHYPLLVMDIINDSEYIKAITLHSNKLTPAMNNATKKSISRATRTFKFVINPNNCGYNLLLSYNEITQKNVCWLVSTTRNPSAEIRTVRYFNKTHIPVLKEIKKLFPAEYIFFVHLVSNLSFSLIHVHAFHYNLYTPIFPSNEQGSRLLKAKYLDDIIELLQIDNNYFSSIVFSV
jgi:hypothetical protein